MTDHWEAPYEVGETLRFNDWTNNGSVAWTVTGSSSIADGYVVLMFKREPPFVPGYFQHKKCQQDEQPIVRYFSREPLMEAEDWERVRVVREDGE